MIKYPRESFLNEQWISGVEFVNVFCLSILFVLLATSISGAQNAQFSADKTSGCFPLTVNFTDASTGSPTSWTWSFGNGNSSSLKNPSAVYTTPGVYTVQLTLSNGSVQTKTGYIVVHDHPHVDFISDKTSGCAPLTVNLSDKTNPGSGIANDWLWVFGDGGTSTSQNPQHTFVSSGNQIISLRVRNQFGCESTEVKTQALRVDGPIVDFDASSLSVCQAPATIQFTNKSTGTSPLLYLWNFGDGKSSSAQNPSNQYTSSGTYSVSLKTTDASGCSGITTRTIGVGGESGLDFLKSASRACIGQEIFFTLQAVKNFINPMWNFGNQTTSTQLNPSVIYTKPGIYQVTLTALLENNTCNSVVTKAIEVIDDAVPDFNFTVNCDFVAKFNNTSTHSTQWLWDFDKRGSSTTRSPEFFFGREGNYLVKLTAYNELGCSKSIEKAVVVPDRLQAKFYPDAEQDCAVPSLSGCVPFTVPFVNTTKSSLPLTTRWTFGDGATSNSKDQSHTYTNAGVYTISLNVSNALGCTSTTSKTVTVANITPTAKFSINTTKACTREKIEFTDQSLNATFWCWDFGDGTTGSGKMITHSYAQAGTYTVKLTAKNGGCSNTFEMIDAIVIGNPVVDFTVAKNCINPYQVTLRNTSTQFHSLEWNFGDGQTSAVDVSSHVYSSTGNYVINLKATNNDTQCTVNFSTAVTIRDLVADFEIDNSKPCRKAPVKFKDKSTSATSWQWNFDNLVTSTLQNPSTSYEDSGTHIVTLSAFDADGCMEQKSLSIDVLNLQGAFSLQSAVSNCNDLTVKFKDLSSGTPAIEGWHWDFGDGQYSTEQEPSHVYTKVGAYPVELILTNANGSCSFIVYNAVVFTIPQPDFSTSRSGHCLKDQISITNYSQNATTFRWNFGNGETAMDLHPTISYSDIGYYDVTLYAKDNYGCEKSLTKPTFITITQPTSTFEAYQTSSECPPLTTIFKNKSAGNIQFYRWDFGDTQKSILSDPSNTYITPGVFDVTLIVTDKNNCRDTTTLHDLISVGGPSGNLFLNMQQSLCTYDSVLFESDAKNAIAYQWDFGDGHVETLAAEDVKHLYQSGGLYKVALILRDEKGCDVSAQGEVQIRIIEPPLVSFTYPQCLFEKDILTLQTQTNESGLSFLWEIDGESKSRDAAFAMSVNEPGDRTVTLHATNENGCMSDTSQVISVQGYIEKIPNVFTPNNIDDINPYFEILGLEKSDWNLYIYNRWGRLVYKKINYDNTWNGEESPAGVYYYTLQNNLCPEKNYKGVINILR